MLPEVQNSAVRLENHDFQWKYKDSQSPGPPAALLFLDRARRITFFPPQISATASPSVLKTYTHPYYTHIKTTKPLHISRNPPGCSQRPKLQRICSKTMIFNGNPRVSSPQAAQPPSNPPFARPSATDRVFSAGFLWKYGSERPKNLHTPVLCPHKDN